MNERLEKIRQLLGELEAEMGTEASSARDREFSALELPLIIQEIVDDLQPLLSPYEAAFYLVRVPSFHREERKYSCAAQW